MVYNIFQKYMRPVLNMGGTSFFKTIKDESVMSRSDKIIANSSGYCDSFDGSEITSV